MDKKICFLCEDEIDDTQSRVIHTECRYVHRKCKEARKKGSDEIKLSVSNSGSNDGLVAPKLREQIDSLL